MNMFATEDGKGEAYSRCQNKNCPHKGIMWYADGHGFHPKTSQEYEIKDGKPVKYTPPAKEKLRKL
jgi:hypothetical protein